MKKNLIILAASAFLSGCVGVGLQGPQAGTFEPLPFDEHEYSKLETTGNSTVTGQVFAKTRGGAVIKGAGNLVVLIPATAYGKQRITEQVIGGKRAATPEDPRYVQYVHQTVADGDGRFTFTDVPAGRYFALSHVTWEAPSANRYIPYTIEGGSVYAEIEVARDSAHTVMLNR